MLVREVFRTDAARGLITLAGYLPAGYPDEAAYLSAVGMLADSGFRILEIGVPCAGAELDGRIIREALDSLLGRGMGIERALQLGGQAAAQHGMAAVGMLYHAAVESTGRAACLDLFVKNDVRALLVPDLPGADWECFAEDAKARGIEPVGFIPPDADERQLAGIVAHAGGFLYIPAYAGTTGEEFGVDQSLSLRFNAVRSAAGSSLPLAVGFGIRLPSHVEAVRNLGADAAVIGTPLVEAAKKGPRAVKDFMERIAAGRGAGAWKT